MSLRILPAIDLRHGKVVQLVGGDPKNVALERPSPVEQAKLFREAGAKWVHVVDLDAAFGERNQWNHLARLLGMGLRVQFGGGVRSMTQVQQLLDLGVERVVIGTQGVKNPEWLREVCRIFPNRIVLAVDARGRNVVVKGWTEATGLDVVELARKLDDAGLVGFLYTNVEKEGRLQGIDPKVVDDLRAAVTKTPILVSGGITSMDDLDQLAKSGVGGAVLGMSVYTGRIDLSQALARHPQPVEPMPRSALRHMSAPPDDETEEEDLDGGDHGFIEVVRSRGDEGDDA